MKLPTFSLPASDGKTYTQDDFQQGVFVVYLYPKDNTPGCTQESNEFQENIKAFQKAGAQIFGLSKDSLKSHDKFIKKFGFEFPLLSDESTEFIDALGSWIEKSMYGRKYMGIDRSTFIIKDGEIVKEWRKVKVKGHVDEVLELVQNI